MKNRPIHENLDTSFVNLSALLKYLRRREFTGVIKIQLNGYRAEIGLENENRLTVREHDQISGRVGEGEEALQRLLIRAREPGGTINVFQVTEGEFVSEGEFDSPNSAAAARPDENSNNPSAQKTIPKPAGFLEANGKLTFAEPENFVEFGASAKFETLAEPETHAKAPAIPAKFDFKKFEKNPPTADGNGGGAIAEKTKAPAAATTTTPPPPAADAAAAHGVSLPDFPFNLSNKFEERARKAQTISAEERQRLLNLTAELLLSLDRTLARAQLDFASAFKAASAEIADDYPFLNPSDGSFSYERGGRVKMSAPVSPKIFAASITEAIRRILAKLEANPKFAETHRHAVQIVLAQMNKHEEAYRKFEFAPHLKKILGV